MGIRTSGLTDLEIEHLLAEVARGTIQPRTAMALLVAKGEPRAQVARRIFYALGGSDQTELDEQGRPRYVGSGKLVAEIEHAIGDGIGA